MINWRPSSVKDDDTCNGRATTLAKVSLHLYSVFNKMHAKQCVNTGSSVTADTCQIKFSLQVLTDAE